MRRANPSEPIMVKILLINETDRHGAERTQADYRSFYQIPSVILGPFLKKNVWPGRNVRSRISRERGRKSLRGTDTFTIPKKLGAKS
jgi:hypothetical protein